LINTFRVTNLFLSLIPFWLVTIEKQSTKVFKVVKTSDFVIELWINGDMEIVKDLLNLVHVFLLHFSPSKTLFAFSCWIWEKHLVDDNVMDVDILFCQLDT